MELTEQPDENFEKEALKKVEVLLVNITWSQALKLQGAYPEPFGYMDIKLKLPNGVIIEGTKLTGSIKAYEQCCNDEKK